MGHGTAIVISDSRGPSGFVQRIYLDLRTCVACCRKSLLPDGDCRHVHLYIASTNEGQSTLVCALHLWSERSRNSIKNTYQASEMPDSS